MNNLIVRLHAEREAAKATPAPAAPIQAAPALLPQADLQALIQQAVNQALTAQQPARTVSPNGTAPSTPLPAPPSTATAAHGAVPVCPLHQVAMEQRSHARGSWYSH